MLQHRHVPNWVTASRVSDWSQSLLCHITCLTPLYCPLTGPEELETGVFCNVCLTELAEGDNTQILNHIKPHTGIPLCYSQVCHKSIYSAFPFKLLFNQFCFVKGLFTASSCSSEMLFLLLYSWEFCSQAWKQNRTKCQIGSKSAWKLVRVAR